MLKIEMCFVTNYMNISIKPESSNVLETENCAVSEVISYDILEVVENEKIMHWKFHAPSHTFS